MCVNNLRKFYIYFGAASSYLEYSIVLTNQCSGNWKRLQSELYCVKTGGRGGLRSLTPLVLGSFTIKKLSFCNITSFEVAVALQYWENVVCVLVSFWI